MVTMSRGSKDAAELADICASWCEAAAPAEAQVCMYTMWLMALHGASKSRLFLPLLCRKYYGILTCIRSSHKSFRGIAKLRAWPWSHLLGQASRLPDVPSLMPIMLHNMNRSSSGFGRQKMGQAVWAS